MCPGDFHVAGVRQDRGQFGRGPIVLVLASTKYERRHGEGVDQAVLVLPIAHGPEQEARFGALARELSLATTAGSDFHGTIEDRKRPGGVYGDAAMLAALEARRR